MAALHEHDANTITMARTLGLIPDDATPRDLQDIVDELNDQQVYAMSGRLLDLLGHQAA
jgi:hypothetical protein